jgi:hypothetical protein
MNFIGVDVWSRVFPSSLRRGGCGINEKPAKPSLAPQTGWSLTSHLSCERPPRPLVQRRLRGIFLVSRPPLLSEEGSRWNRFSA